HLWEKQNGRVNGKPVLGVGNGKSDFGGEVRQMMPPYMEDNKNTVERLIANMDYACVSGCVVTQEYIDGNQDGYLLSAKAKYSDRIKICSLYEETDAFLLEGVDGVKICAGRLADPDLKKLLPVFQKVERAGKFISIDLADGDAQVEDMEYLIERCPDLRIAIGHFGMVTTNGWQKQIALAKHKNVYIESGGLTWLFHKEFYPYPSAIDAILEARDICGMEKLMWGSDYPRTMTDITYIMAVRFITETQKLSEEEKKAFLGENAIRFYEFKELPKMQEIPNML
ncbi:MAG: amidohydrolase, partial [Lachnospiraceae bacterium]|nr:amidohydrolase [Lachnospiraceae bacterium]